MNSAGPVCGILERLWATFCLCTMNLPDANLKTGLISLAEKISRLHNVEFAAWLLLMLLQVYHEKNVGQKKKDKMYSLERKEYQEV